MMVIFHSYGSLPDGIWLFHSDFILYTLWWTNIAVENALLAIDFPTRDGDIHTCGSLPDGIWLLQSYFILYVLW